jgi:hypothetical protein
MEKPEPKLSQRNYAACRGTDISREGSLVRDVGPASSEGGHRLAVLVLPPLGQGAGAEA